MVSGEGWEGAFKGWVCMVIEIGIGVVLGLYWGCMVIESLSCYCYCYCY